MSSPTRPPPGSGGDSERLPEVGPSLRDATRVAGANPEIWTDILSSNRESVADAVDSVIARLQQASHLIREGDSDRLAEWQRGAGRARRALLDAESADGPVHELRLVVPNRPGVVAGLALALGEARINIEDMALYPAQDMSTGAISVWVAGAAEAERAATLVREMGHTVSVVGAGD